MNCTLILQIVKRRLRKEKEKKELEKIKKRCRMEKGKFMRLIDQGKNKKIKKKRNKENTDEKNEMSRKIVETPKCAQSDPQMTKEPERQTIHITT